MKLYIPMSNKLNKNSKIILNFYYIIEKYVL